MIALYSFRIKISTRIQIGNFIWLFHQKRYWNLFLMLFVWDERGLKCYNTFQKSYNTFHFTWQNSFFEQFWSPLHLGTQPLLFKQISVLLKQNSSPHLNLWWAKILSRKKINKVKAHLKLISNCIWTIGLNNNTESIV